MPHISKTVRAESDLDEHWFYIAQDNISAADALLDGIEQRLRLLANQPGMGRPRPELAPELRSFSIERYVIYYYPQDQGIVLVRVLHSARDIMAIADSGGFTE